MIDIRVTAAKRSEAAHDILAFTDVWGNGIRKATVLKVAQNKNKNSLLLKPGIQIHKLQNSCKRDWYIDDRLQS